jgi:phage terminase large subunit-like protein
MTTKKLPSRRRVDSATKRWIRNAADERAVRNGCWFDEARGQLPIDWAEEYLRLWEGEQAGEPLIAHDWQVEGTLRLFGWVRHSDRWGRDVRRFTQASFWVPKKSKKSPTAAWWGLYLFAGDGEQGQKVFSGAKDGTQAGLMQRHAFEMAKASPALAAVCKFRENDMRITHVPTRSTYTILSSGDSRSQKAKEGINGSIIIDETHVVDDEFMRRINRAGISRSEPLLIEVSTAGKDPNCYGRRRYDHGKRVEAGQTEDQGLLFLCSAATCSSVSGRLL